MNQKAFIHPPKAALRFFRWYCRTDRQEELEGDLLEMHQLRQHRISNRLMLSLLFWWDVIKCFKPYSVKIIQHTMNFSLYQSYLTVALRNTKKNIGPIGINILGMGLALGFCITVYVLTAFNTEFDSTFEADNVYRLHSLREFNGQQQRFELAPLPLAHTIKDEIAGIEDITYFESQYGTVLNRNEYFRQHIGSAKENFFDFFPLKLRYGNKDGLSNPKGIYLTSEIAKKYFGDEVALGKRLTLFLEQQKGMELEVVGVFEKIPLNSSFIFDVLVNHEAVLNAFNVTSTEWDNDYNVAVYLKTQSQENVLTSLQKYVPEQNANQENWQIQAFDIWSFHDKRYTESNINYSPANRRVDKTAIVIFIIMATLILLVACFNLANTAMALMANRVREIGIRKTLGTTNQQLFVQFMLEMMITTTSSFLLAIALSNYIAAYVFGLFDAAFFLQDVSIVRFIPFILAFLLLCTLMAGVFPAMYAWKFSPISILSKTQSLKGVGWWQKILTVGQYTVSICLLVSAWSFSQNSEFFKTIDLGYNYEDILAVPIEDPDDFNMLQNEIAGLTGIAQVIGTNDHHGMSTDRVMYKTDTNQVEVAAYHISPEYLETMEIRMLEGRGFLANSEADQENAIIVSREFVSQFLYDRVALNSKIKVNGMEKTIIGISDNIIHELYNDYKPRPIIYLPTDQRNYAIVLAKTSGKTPEMLEDEVEAIWAANFDSPYRGKPQRMVSSFYASRDARNLKILFLGIAALGSMLSLIGIFSLASMNVKKRTKEISIRKVLGATFRQVMLVVNRSFTTILFSALILGVVSGIFLSDMVLASIYKFYRNASEIESLLIGMGVIVVAILFISFAAYKPVNANPSEGLRSE